MRAGTRLTVMLVVVAAVTVLVVPSAGAVTFTGPTNFPAGSGAFSVATGHFDAGGTADLAVANSGTNTVSLLFGAGDGTFSAPTNITVGSGPTFVTVSDFNGDSKDDLAVANGGDDTVSILLGDGAGGFSASSGSPFTVGDLPVSIAVGDFNGDSKADLAVANLLGSSGNRISILLGNGSGGFSGPTNFDAGTFPRSVVTGQFDADSNLDLAVANQNDNNVSILAGNGSGSFGAPSNVSVGSGPFYLATGEFDGNSNPDLAVANSGSDNVSVVLGNGTGGFAPSSGSPFAAGNAPDSVAVGEFDGNSQPDLAVANLGAFGVNSNVSILTGTGGGNFSAPTNFGAGQLPRSVVVGQFTAGSQPDLAIANQATDDVSILLGLADPSLSTQATDAGIGQAVHDTATLAGGNSPTGTITFNAFSDSQCTGTPDFTDTASVSGNGAYQSDDFTPDNAGTYRWTVDYSGDSDNDPASSNCFAPNETSTIDPASPTLGTSATASIVAGASIADTATLAGGHNASGDITFSAYGPDDATCTGPPAFTREVSVNGDGDYPSGNFTPMEAGTYLWTADYSGDANNDPATSACNASNESSNVDKATTGLSTQSSANTVIGGQVRDTATLSGAFAARGDIAFSLYGPGDDDCSESPVFTDGVSVTGNGAYRSGSFVPTEPGTYRWTADYSGDPRNTGSSSGCSSRREGVWVQKATPTLSTQASLSGTSHVSDRATIGGGRNPRGTLVFRLYDRGDNTCSGGPIFTDKLDVSGNGAYRSRLYKARPGTYRFTASFTGDDRNRATHGSCNDPGETVTVPAG